MKRFRIAIQQFGQNSPVAFANISFKSNLTPQQLKNSIEQFLFDSINVEGLSKKKNATLRWFHRQRLPITTRNLKFYKFNRRDMDILQKVGYDV